jgi:predicted DNA-binding transcriptional regulator YafY
MPKKWDGAKPGEKLLTLYSLLMVSRRKLSLTEISRQINASKQIVSRLIFQLEGSRFGKVITEKRGREVFYGLDRPKEIPRLALTPEALRELAICRNFLCHVLPEGMQKNITSTLRLTGTLVPEGIDLASDDRLGRAMFKGRIDYSPFGEMLETLIKAITENGICQVGYQAVRQGPVKEFDFAPKQLKVFHEAIYAEGWYVSDKGEALYDNPATLAVHRLKKLTQTIRINPSLPALEADTGAFGVFGDTPFAASIKFSPTAATYIAERQWSKGETKTFHDDGSLTLTMNINNQYEAVSFILSFGAEAEVLSPDWLRQDIFEILTESLKKYKVFPSS